MLQNILWKTMIYYKICNIQISPHNFDPARLLSICLLRSLKRSMWVAIFPQKARTTVRLGFCINPSSMHIQYRCIRSCHVKLGFNAKVRITFGTVQFVGKRCKKCTYLTQACHRAGPPTDAASLGGFLEPVSLISSFEKFRATFCLLYFFKMITLQICLS